MDIQLALQILELSTAIVGNHLKGAGKEDADKAVARVKTAEALVRIVQAGNEAHRQLTGREIDPELVRPQERLVRRGAVDTGVPTAE